MKKHWFWVNCFIQIDSRDIKTSKSESVCIQQDANELDDVFFSDLEYRLKKHFEFSLPMGIKLDASDDIQILNVSKLN